MAGRSSATGLGPLLVAAVLILRARFIDRSIFSAEAFLADHELRRGPPPPPLPRTGRASRAGPAAGDLASTSPGAGSDSLGALLSPAAALAALGLVARSLARSAGSRSQRAPAPARAATATKGVEDWGLSTEVAALERAAAQLRADAERLEADMEQRRREEQAKWFSFFDADGSGGVDAAELQRGMKELVGTEVDESMAERLLQAHDQDRDGLLQLQEFDTNRLETTLEKFRAEDYDRELAARQESRRQEQEAKEEAELQRRREAYEARLPVANEDTGLLTRTGSVLVYLLPMLDALKFGAPLAAASPLFRMVIDPLMGPLHLLKAVPYGQLLAFLAMQTLSDKVELPLLLRFNMRQAVVLDIILGLLQLLQVFATYAFYGEASADLVSQWDSNGAVFLALLGCITYSSFLSLMGFMPNSIPWISPYAERYMAPTRRAQAAQEDGNDAPPSA